MIEKIYQLFYDKLPDSLAQVLPKYDRCQLVTCLNPYYLVMLSPKDYPLYENFDYISSDGDRKSTRLNSSHRHTSRMPSSA